MSRVRSEYLRVLCLSAYTTTDRMSPSLPWIFFKKRASCSWISVLSCPSSRCSWRSEEHTSELQSRGQLVCRLPLEKKNEDAATLPLEPAAWLLTACPCSRAS